MESVGKTYGDHTVFSGVSLTVERGDKLAFVGRNGEGKSTLVKCIMQQLEHEARSLSATMCRSVTSHKTKPRSSTAKSPSMTPSTTWRKGEIRLKIRDLLGAFMFGGEEGTKKVKVLSGGERTRLAILKLLLEPFNLLILDEPTNHLDLRTKDVLKQALQDFDGTLIVVSHDRDFLDGLVTKVYEFGRRKSARAPLRHLRVLGKQAPRKPSRVGA